MRPSIRVFSGFFALSLALSACSTPMSEEEAEMVTDMTRDIRPEGRIAREDIARQDILTQATFWAKEFEINPADREAALKLARLVRTMGNPTRAAVIGNQILALYPEDKDILLVTGQALIEDGHAKNAIAYLQAAVKQDPTDATVLSVLGVAYDQSDRHKLAMQNFQKATALRPDDPKILSNIGISYALQGDPQTAESWLRKAVALPTADIQARQNLALVLGLQGKFEEAEEMSAQDMPTTVAKGNVSYVKEMIIRPNSWQALRGE